MQSKPSQTSMLEGAALAKLRTELLHPAEPNFCTQRNTVAASAAVPRSAMSSRTSRNESRYREY